MINMQNQIYWNKESWNNQRLPAADWGSGSMEEIRKYWGWNEVPVDGYIVEDPMQWDAVMIKLPAAICQDWDWLGSADSAQCLGDREKKALDEDLDSFVQNGKLNPGSDNVGSRPGSYVVFAREFGEAYDSSTNSGKLGSSFAGINWQRYFFCESVTLGKYEIVHMKPSEDSNGNGACYIQYAGSGPSPAPSPPPSWGSGAIVHRASGKCLGAQYSDTSMAQSLVVAACDGSGAQSWDFDDDGSLKLTWEDKCADAGENSQSSTLMLWECNGQNQQKFGFDEGMGTIYGTYTSDASLCLDVQNGGTADENLAWLWECNSNDNQVFDWYHSTKVQADIFA